MERDGERGGNMWEVVWKWGWPLYHLYYLFISQVCVYLCVCVCVCVGWGLPTKVSWLLLSSPPKCLVGFYLISHGRRRGGKKKKGKCIKIYCAAFSFSLFQMFPSTRRKLFQLKKVWLWTAMHGSGMTGREEGIHDCEEERRNSLDGVRICIHSSGLQSSAVCTGRLSRSWKCRIFHPLSVLHMTSPAAHAYCKPTSIYTYICKCHNSHERPGLIANYLQR